MKRLIMIIFCWLSPIILTLLVQPLHAEELIGIVTSGETGSADAGKLLNIDFTTGIATEVGDTGLSSITALTFDPTTRMLIAGTRNGEIYVLDQDTAAPTRIVDVLEAPPQSEIPAGVIFLGFSSLSSLDFHPVSGQLFGIVQDMLGDFLVRIDLDAVDSLGRLEFDVLGVVGSNNYAYPGAPIGFVNVFGTAFDTLGTLFGSGIDPDVLEPLLIQIQTNPGTIPLAAGVGPTASSILSFPRAMAFRPSDGLLYSTGYNASTEHVLFRFDPSSGAETIRGEVRIQGSAGSPVPVSGQVSGLALVTELPNLPPRPPVITDFSPPGGNLGIPIRILGSGFSANGSPNVTAVRFNGYPALGDLVVVSDTELRVITPLASTGPITVMNSEGTATSADDFISSTMEITPEFNQGIPTQPLIAGKDTLVRLLTASSASTAALPIPVTFGSATLRCTKPSGATLNVPATHYTKIFQNAPDNLDPSHRSNINFFIDGDDIDEDGAYLFSLEVRHFTLDESVPGPQMFYSDQLENVIPGMDEFTAFIVLGGVWVNGDFVGPDEASMDNIFEGFDQISRTFPVRNGVSRLGQDISAGVRFEISSTAVVLGTGLNSIDVTQDLFNAAQNTVVPMLDSYNESNSDKARFAAVFAGDEVLSATAAAAGRGEWPGDFSVSTIRDAPNSVKTMPHEFGHNMGLVPESSPNYNASDRAHTLNDLFPPGEGPRQVRAFNVPERMAVLDRFGQPILPRSIMLGGIRPANGRMFLEDFEYEFTRDAYALSSASQFALDTSAALKLFTIIVDIHSSGTAEVIQSYESTTVKPVTQTIPGSLHSLAFLDASGTILRDDPFSVSFWVGDSMNDMTLQPSSILSLVRPIPEGTVRVEIRLKGQILASVDRSGGPPSVEVLFPTGGESFAVNEEVEILWDASDPDVSPLTFNVSYSPDGARWTPIAAAVSGFSTTWQTDTSAGSDGGRIRVTATDGFHTVSSESALFTVAQKPPMVTILKPENEQQFLEHDTIGLRGVAFDFESGILVGPALEWSSSVDGTLGTGPEVDLPPGTLTPGEHILQLSATDGITFEIKETSITVLADTDGDRIPDNFENSYESQDPNDPFDNAQDVDSDGLTSLEESDAGIDPENPDSDGDGIPDGEEISAGGDPTNISPVCDAGGPYLVECSGTTTVQLNGSGSFDDDGDPLTFTWSGPFTERLVFDEVVEVQFTDLGVFDIILEVSDGKETTDCTTAVTIEDTITPSIICPADVKIECDQSTAPSNTGEATATDICDTAPRIIYSNVETPGSCPQEKTITRTWTAIDTSGNTGKCTQTIEVVDTTPPEINVSVSPTTLWPPNHKMFLITPTVITSDNCDPDPVVELISITMNEGDEANTFDPAFDASYGDGHTPNDIQVDEDDNIYLRAERSGAGNGRIYTITYTATDASGNTTEASATVTVHHDQQ